MWVLGVYVTASKGASPQEMPEVRAVPGHGLEGDRYYRDAPAPDTEITLIEMESIEAVRRDYRVDLAPGDARRQVVTRGVALNHLVGHEFQVGGARLRGMRLCEPCARLASLTHRSLLTALIHRGGLRAQILTEGVIRPGDAIIP